MKKYLYVMTGPSYGRGIYVKIGVSDNPTKRLKSLHSTHYNLLKIYKIYEPENSFATEAAAKKKFRRFLCKGTEYFDMDDVSIVIDFLDKAVGVQNALL